MVSYDAWRGASWKVRYQDRRWLREQFMFQFRGDSGFWLSSEGEARGSFVVEAEPKFGPALLWRSSLPEPVSDSDDPLANVSDEVIPHTELEEDRVTLREKYPEVFSDPVSLDTLDADFIELHRETMGFLDRDWDSGTVGRWIGCRAIVRTGDGDLEVVVLQGQRLDESGAAVAHSLLERVRQEGAIVAYEYEDPHFARPSWNMPPFYYVKRRRSGPPLASAPGDERGDPLVELHVPLNAGEARDGEDPYGWIDTIMDVLVPLDEDGAEMHDDGEQIDDEYVFFIAGAAESKLLEIAARLAYLPGVPAGAYAIVTDTETSELGVGRRVNLER